MTRLDIENAVGRRTNKNTSTWDSATQTRIRHFVNTRLRRILAKPGMDHFRDDTLTFASVADQARYALVNIAKLKRMWETTNDRLLMPMSLDEYRRISPDASAVTGTPTHYVWQGYEPVSVQPANASEIFVISTSASDTNTAYVELDITSGYPRTLSVVMTGTTGVSLNTAVTTGIRIRKFYLSAAAVGTVTLREDSGVGTVLATIGIGQTQQKYWVFYLYPRPSAVITYTADYTLQNTDLAQNNDEPRIPEDFHALLELGATMDELNKTDDGRYIIVEREYNALMGDLDYWIATQRPGNFVSPEKPSQLGAWYPAGT